MTRTIAVINQKGGVGKTTTAANLGVALARSGKNVLLVDADPQAHLSVSLGHPDAEPSLYEVLTGKGSLQDVAVSVEKGVDLVPADITLARADMELSWQPGKDFILREVLASASERDFTLIDCPPSLGLLTLNALTASDEVLIPLQAEFLPLRGISQLIEAIDLVRSRTNPGLSITGVLFTRWDGRKVLSRETLEQAGTCFGNALMKTRIRECVSLAEAPGNGQHIFDYAPRSNGASDYLDMAHEVLAMNPAGRARN
ncbi:MAG TPA: ParA family protein [Synergistales bacterium]|jgi:chromosome partitioning protein|nr:ParA family protein [Synergistales bacterium]HRV71952.1 ParA family protein [Thermovirgaceae bacterium]